jgi:hypothetical protein
VLTMPLCSAMINNRSFRMARWTVVLVSSGCSTRALIRRNIRLSPVVLAPMRWGEGHASDWRCPRQGALQPTCFHCMPAQRTPSADHPCVPDDTGHALRVSIIQGLCLTWVHLAHGMQADVSTPKWCWLVPEI